MAVGESQGVGVALAQEGTEGHGAPLSARSRAAAFPQRFSRTNSAREIPRKYNDVRPQTAETTHCAPPVARKSIVIPGICGMGVVCN